MSDIQYHDGWLYFDTWNTIRAKVAEDTLAYHRTGCITDPPDEWSWSITHKHSLALIAVAPTWQRARKAIKRLLSAGLRWDALSDDPTRWRDWPDYDKAVEIVEKLIEDGILSAKASEVCDE